MQDVELKEITTAESLTLQLTRLTTNTYRFRVPMQNHKENFHRNSDRESKDLKELVLDQLGLILSLRKAISLVRTPSKSVEAIKIFVKVFHTLTKIHLLNQVLRIS